jgi:hypothetical protein
MFHLEMVYGTTKAAIRERRDIVYWDPALLGFIAKLGIAELGTLLVFTALIVILGWYGNKKPLKPRK